MLCAALLWRIVQDSQLSSLEQCHVLDWVLWSQELVGRCVQIFEWVKEHGGEPIIPFSGILESKLFDMPDDEKAAYLKEVCCMPSLDFCTTC